MCWLFQLLISECKKRKKMHIDVQTQHDYETHYRIMCYVMQCVSLVHYIDGLRIAL